MFYIRTNHTKDLYCHEFTTLFIDSTFFFLILIAFFKSYIYIGVVNILHNPRCSLVDNYLPKLLSKLFDSTFNCIIRYNILHPYVLHLFEADKTIYFTGFLARILRFNL